MVDVRAERADPQRCGDRNRPRAVPKKVLTQSDDELGNPVFSVVHAGSRIASPVGTSK
jgi:hypothetical protein